MGSPELRRYFFFTKKDGTEQNLRWSRKPGLVLRETTLEITTEITHPPTNEEIFEEQNAKGGGKDRERGWGSRG